MRLLCDYHVATKSLPAFEATEWITCERVADVLPDAPDREIARYATANDCSSSPTTTIFRLRCLTTISSPTINSKVQPHRQCVMRLRRSRPLTTTLRSSRSRFRTGG